MPFDGYMGEEGLLDAYERAEQIQAAREDPNAFIEYAFKGEGGLPLVQEAGHREWQAIWTEYEKSVILASVGTGKALPVETEIETPFGWTPIGGLRVGDFVMGGDGLATRVNYVSPVWTDRTIYELTFGDVLGDNPTIRCDAEHLWLVCSKRTGEWSTISTANLIATFDEGWRIPCVGLYGPERRIIAWRQVETCPVRCIAVEAAHHTYIATRRRLVTHNTTGLRARLLWEIGKDRHDTRIAYISATQAHPKKQLGSLKDEIMRNRRVQHVFPHLRPAEGDREVWSQTQILVDRDSSHPDVTLECYGLYGAILGSRKNIIVFDDLCNMANTLTAASRQKMANWLAEVLSRLKGKVKVWAIGHIWHEDDALQELVRRGFFYARYQATRPDPAGAVDERGRVLQVPCFPRTLPPPKIASLAEELGPVYSRMMLYNEMPPALTSRFRDKWFETCLRRGRGQTFLNEWTKGVGRVVTGIDLGHKKKAGSDFTAMVTTVVFDDGTRLLVDARGGGMKDEEGNVQGRWKGDEIAWHIKDLQERFDPQFYSEDNGGQSLFNELMLPFIAVPVTGTWTSTDKYDYANGIESLGRELMSGMWILPCDDDLVARPGVHEMIKGAKGYDPAKHPADLLMAWWICRKGIVQGEALRRRYEAERLAAGRDVPIE